MVDASRIRVQWSGFQGAPGFSHHWFSDLKVAADIDAAALRVKNFYQAFSSYFPNGIVFTIDPVVSHYDIGTFKLVSTSPVTTVPTPASGAATGAYAGGTGAAVTWRTAAFVLGRQVKGRTYLVPLVGCCDNTGTLTPGFITAAQTAGNTLIGSGATQLQVWSRKPTLGVLTPATVATVTDKAAQLRSRRD